MPPIKRPLEYGDEGADVLAVQQGLWRALDPGTNARNRNYGDKTVADMAAFQASVGIQPTGSMGQASLDALWPRMSADQQQGYQSYQPKAPAIARALYSGDTGDDVLAVQRMLYRAGIGATNAKNGNYGQKTVNDVIALQRRYGIQATGNMGQKTFTQLWQFGTEDDHDLYLSFTPGPPPSSVEAIRQALVSAARWSIANPPPDSDYQQIRPYPRALVLPFLTDCSGSTSCFYCVAGGPDPNGDDFSGYGYTGTQKSNGTRIDSGARQPGDLVFHGNTEGAQHVTMYLGNGRSYSFGSDPPKEVSWNYRPVDEVRRYL